MNRFVASLDYPTEQRPAGIVKPVCERSAVSSGRWLASDHVICSRQKVTNGCARCIVRSANAPLLKSRPAHKLRMSRATVLLQRQQPHGTPHHRQKNRSVTHQTFPSLGAPSPEEHQAEKPGEFAKCSTVHQSDLTIPASMQSPEDGYRRKALDSALVKRAIGHPSYDSNAPLSVLTARR